MFHDVPLPNVLSHPHIAQNPHTLTAPSVIVSAPEQTQFDSTSNPIEIIAPINPSQITKTPLPNLFDPFPGWNYCVYLGSS